MNHCRRIDQRNQTDKPIILSETLYHRDDALLYIIAYVMLIWAAPIPAEILYHRDDALLYIAYVMLIWAAPIPADRWHCSLWP